MTKRSCLLVLVLNYLLNFQFDVCIRLHDMPVSHEQLPNNKFRMTGGVCMAIKIRNKSIKSKYCVSYGLVIYLEQIIGGSGFLK